MNFELDKAQLAEFSQRQGVTLFTTLWASLAVLLHRYCQEDDIVIGTPVANRNNHNSDLVGLFVNTLALRLDLSASPGFAELLQQAKATLFAGMKHAELPFERVVDALKPERSMAHSPIFQVLLALQNTPKVDLELQGVQTRFEPLDNGATEMDLVFNLDEHDDALSGFVQYSTALFKAERIERMVAHWQQLLDVMMANPECDVDEVEYFGPTQWPVEKVVVEQTWLEQIARHREGLAVDGHSYAEFHRDSDAVAYELLARGLSPHSVVAVSMPQNYRWVVSMVGVMKAAMVYLPLVPDLAAERRDYVLQNSEVALVIDENFTPQADPQSLPVVTLDDPAYQIYTSGSTGKPKGVMLHHRGLANLAQAQTRLLEVTSQSKVLQFATMSFDASIFDVAMTFAAGACLCLPGVDDIKTGDDLVELFNQRQITHVLLPPAVMAVTEPEGAHTLTHVISGGDHLTAELCDRWKRGRTLINAYGPTEATVCASFFRYPGEGPVTIGQGMDNVELSIVDRCGLPVPDGYWGELLIRSPGVADGYINQPELSARAFAHGGYLSGDIARRLDDGNIELAGRRDRQVKINGYRIEPGDVEAAVRSLDGVDDCVVLKTGEALTVWCATERDTLDLSQLPLPPFMHPKHCHLIPALPRTRHGKIDTERLPRNEQAVATVAADSTLVGLWQQVLGKRQVGLDDNFFHLGGNSIDAARLIAQINSTMGSHLTVKSLFLYPTVRQLQSQLDAPKPPLQAAKLALPDDPNLTVEHRPLLSLLLTGQQAPVDAVAIGYLTDDLPQHMGEAVDTMFGGMPLLVQIRTTALGRVGVIVLPHKATALYADTNALVDSVTDALHIARQIGAKRVSLTGILPSASNLGLLIAKRTAGKGLPAVTTGHATTCATVVMTLEKLLTDTGRDLTDETVGFIGLGSIGVGSLKLMLCELPPPKKLLLADVYQKQADLMALVEALDFDGEIELVDSSEQVPDHFYQAGVIVGASNVADLLVVDKLRPGTLIVDDSGPHCFDVDQAMARLEQHHDLLFTEGGVLNTPDVIDTLLYLPKNLSHQLPKNSPLVHVHANEITGCILSSLLGGEPQTGVVQLTHSKEQLTLLKQQGFGPADWHCDSQRLGQDSIAAFRQAFNPEHPQSPFDNKNKGKH